jgi:hypothetical protein
VTVPAAVVAAVVGLLTVAFAATWTGDDRPDDTDVTNPEPDEVSMTATIVQQRTAEGTREVGVRVANDGETSFTVDSVRLVWSLFPAAPTTPKDTVFAPGSLIDLVTTYAEPDCSTYPAAAPDRPAAELHLTSPVDQVVTQPLDRHGQAWLRRLYDRECDAAALQAIAAIHFDDTWTRTVVDGEPWLRTSIVIERRPGGAPEPVTVLSLLGSVLLDYVPVEPSVPVATLPAGASTLRIPVLIGSSDLCTPHAFAESKQTFLLNTYVRHGDAAVQRVILTPDRPTQVRVLRVVREACKTKP